MPDRISNFRQLRLVVSPDYKHERAAWLATCITVVKGVPYSSALDDGILHGYSMPSTSEECVSMLEHAVGALSRRWKLYPTQE